MHIKKVIIQGFRSYREVTDIEEFSAHHNVIVGRNGSGKTNFFYAIQFILSDDFTHLRVEQRQGLLHEGSGPRVMSAKVEIIFDNTDARIPIEKEEVSLVRQIGNKKDQYFLDAKAVTRTEVVNLMESAGFSRSNPYYIVRQGKINELATAADPLRLKLLREVAGTRVYDERKEESACILRETEGKRDKVENLLKYIEDRLKTLENEKEELKEYQKWDKQKRSLEYTLYDHELRSTRRKLDELSEKREEMNEKQNDLQTEQMEANERIRQLTSKKAELDAQMDVLKEKRDSLSNQQTEQFQVKTQLDLKAKDIKESTDRERSSRKRAEERLDELLAEINDKQSRLETINPQFAQVQQQETGLNTRMLILEGKRKDLYAKMGFKDRFETEAERDEFLKREIRTCNRQIDEKRALVAELERDRARDERRREDVAAELTRVSAQLEEHRNQLEQGDGSAQTLKQRYETLIGERRDIWREENTLTQQMAALREETNNNRGSMRALASRSINTGIESVKKVLASFAEQGVHQAVIDGYHGTLIENFDCDQVYDRAIETTAGNTFSLFNHIVDTDQVGTKILQEFNKQKLPGEAHFLPLNRLDAREPRFGQYPEAEPLIEQLKFDDSCAAAVRFAFGRTLVCRSLEVATKLAKTEQLDCVTLEGDKVQHKGALSGGYVDVRKSRLALQRAFCQLESQRVERDGQMAELRSRLSRVEVDIQRASHAADRADANEAHVRVEYHRLAESKRELRRKLSELEQSQLPRDGQLREYESQLEQLEARKENLTHDMEADRMSSQLSADEQERLQAIQDELKQLRQNADAVAKRRAELENEKIRLDNQLHENLLRKKESIQARVQDIELEDNRKQLEILQTELRSINQRINEISQQILDVDEESSEKTAEAENLQRDLDGEHERDKELTTQIQDFAKKTESICSRLATLSQKREEHMKLVRELGSLPAEAFDKYQSWSMSKINKQLNECAAELRKYENVNKKALDQFVSFSEQKEKLVKRKDEVDRAHNSIVDLMRALNHRKYEAIQLTFKQVSKYFEEVFSFLVPEGRGELVMKTGGVDASSVTDASGEQESIDEAHLIEQFTGVGIKVAFTGADETREMQQLSGGQKSLVALALIFAIQKCDPAPFYLFDEIDAALDAQHRKAVADMIRQLAQNAQFITTTFRPELLDSADKFYGVRFRNKVSHIDTISRAEAADFVEDDATHG